MTWWVIDNAIAESTLPAPCKLVLRTLSDQINPPPDWDAKDPEAWDPASHPEALLVRYDRARLSLLTSYSPNTLRLLMQELSATKDAEGQRLDPVLYLVQPARQHAVAIYGLDLAALRRHRTPALETLDAKRKAAREDRRRGRQARVPQRAQDKSPEPIQRAQDTSSDDASGLKISPPFTSSLSPLENRSPFFGEPASAPTAPEKNERPGSGSTPQTKTRTPLTEAPRRLTLTPSFLDWWNASELIVLDLQAEEVAFLGHCRRQEIPNRNWLEAFKAWLLDAHRRWQRGEPCASSPHPCPREPHSPARIALWAQLRAEDEAKAAADDHEWADPRANSSLHAPCHQVHQRGAPCPARPATLAAD